MKKNFSAFLMRLLLYSLIIWVCFAFLRNTIPAKFYFEYTHYLVIFFFLTTAIFHYGLLSSSASSSRNLVTYYMLSTALKLFMYAGIIIGYALLMPEHAIPFITHFFVLYILFTVFEVSVVYKHFKSGSVLPAGPNT